MNIIFIDDEPKNIKDYIEMLKLEKYEVDRCLYTENLEEMLKKKYDLAILDVIMTPKNTSETNDKKFNIGNAGIEYAMPLLKEQNIPTIILTNIDFFTNEKESELFKNNKNLKCILNKFNTTPTTLINTIKQIQSSLELF